MLLTLARREAAGQARWRDIDISAATWTIRETKNMQEASGTEGWTRHDLRRTGATMLGELGEYPDIIEAALAEPCVDPLATGRHF